MRHRLRAFLVPALAATALATAAACAGDSPPTAAGGDGDGRVSILLTDAPGDVVAAVVTIEQIYLTRGSDADEETPPTEGSARHVLFDRRMTVDLLTLAGAVDTVVRDAAVPAGSYGGIRLVVSGGYLEVENDDGTTSFYASSPDYEGLPEGVTADGELQKPSWASAGLKVQLPGGLTVSDDDSEAVLVDFDVKQSFGRQAGKSGKWVMRPVIKGARQ